MEFQAGDQVILRHTGQKGIIQEIDPSGMAMVRFPDTGEVIPVDTDHMISEKASSIPEKTPTSNTKPPIDKDNSLAIRNDSYPEEGVYVQIATDESMQQFSLFLANNTPYPFVCTVHIDFEHEHWPAQAFKLESHKKSNIGKIPRDHLNEKPRLKVDFIRFSTRGKEDEHKVEKRLKPKVLFNRLEPSDDGQKMQVIFSLLEPEAWQKNPEDEDLKKYTRKHTTGKASHWDSDLNQIDIDPEEWAHFDNVIDLHLDKLHIDPHGLSNADKLRIQLEHFDRFLGKAIRLGASSIFVIHGIGKGKLRDAIASRVMNHPHVKTFRNEYHPKFGFGATEILID